MKALIAKYKAWRERRYWAARHLEFLQAMIREDWRWLASTPGAGPFIERYHRAACSGWYQLAHQSSGDFRATLEKAAGITATGSAGSSGDAP